MWGVATAKGMRGGQGHAVDGGGAAGLLYTPAGQGGQRGQDVTHCVVRQGRQQRGAASLCLGKDPRRQRLACAPHRRLFPLPWLPAGLSGEQSLPL